MTFKHHELKTWPEFYADLIADRKPFELRKNDRDFEVGDELDLHEFDSETGKFTGRVTIRIITYILGHRPDAGCAATFGLKPGYVILGIAGVAQRPTERYLVWSNQHKCWWRPNSAGYTRDVREAGRYSRAEAVDISWTARSGWLDPKKIPDEIAVAEGDLPDFALSVSSTTR